MKTLHIPALVSLLAALAAGCSSGPESSDADVSASPAVEAELRGLDSENPRERAVSRDRLVVRGRGVCRALGRELTARVEKGDTGPGFACVIRLLGAFGGPEALDPLRQAALKRSLDPALRVEAIRSLGMTGSAACVPALAECAGAEEPLPVRIAAAAALAAFTGSAQARDALKTAACTGPDPLREEACRSLIPCDEEDLREFFLVRLVDGSPVVRLAAVGYFQKRPCTEAAAPLGALAKCDRDLRVVMAAGRALEGMGGRAGN